MVVLTGGLTVGAPVQSPPDEYRLVRMDLANLSDEDLAKLIASIADAVPFDQWPTVRIEEGDGVERIVDRSYDIYSADRHPTQYSKPYPESAQFLRALIEERNSTTSSEIQPGQELRVPPIPSASEDGLGVGWPRIHRFP